MTVDVSGHRLDRDWALAPGGAARVGRDGHIDLHRVSRPERPFRQIDIAPFRRVAA
jgi:hypothetical protein